MKCSDCAFWQTDGCKTNPEGTNYNYAEDFACFVHDPNAKARRVAAGIVEEPNGEEEIDIHEQSKKATRDRNRALGWGTGLLLGGFFSVFYLGYRFLLAAFNPESSSSMTLHNINLVFAYLFLILGGIAVIAGVVLFLAALMSFVSCANLRRRVEKRDTHPPDEPAEQ